MTKQALRRLVVMSDIHAGSTVSICPPGFVTEENRKIGLSPFQDWLWECWLDSAPILARTSPVWLRMATSRGWLVGFTYLRMRRDAKNKAPQALVNRLK